MKTKEDCETLLSKREEGLSIHQFTVNALADAALRYDHDAFTKILNIFKHIHLIFSNKVSPKVLKAAWDLKNCGGSSSLELAAELVFPEAAAYFEKVYKSCSMALDLARRTEAPSYTIKNYWGFGKFESHFKALLVAHSDPIVEFTKDVRTLFLLSGPTGTGKTFLLTCVAGTLGRPVRAAKLSELKGSLVGQTEKAIRAYFEDAVKSALETSGPAPFLIFDEIDAYAKVASGTGENSDSPRGMTATIQTCLDDVVKAYNDGVTEYSKLLLVGATTNYLDNIEPAVKGRFHATIEVEQNEDPFEFLKFKLTDAGIEYTETDLGNVSEVLRFISAREGDSFIKHIREMRILEPDESFSAHIKKAIYELKNARINKLDFSELTEIHIQPKDIGSEKMTPSTFLARKGFAMDPEMTWVKAWEAVDLPEYEGKDTDPKYSDGVLILNPSENEKAATVTSGFREFMTAKKALQDKSREVFVKFSLLSDVS